MSKIGASLYALDDRVLHLTERRARLKTPDGWRRMAARWPWFLGYAVVLGLAMVVFEAVGSQPVYQFLPLIGVACFRAGRLKAEDDRLAGRGYFEKNRPPGL